MKKLTDKELREAIINLIKDNPKESYDGIDIYEQFSHTDQFYTMADCYTLLFDMVQKDELTREYNGVRAHYKLIDSSNPCKGCDDDCSYCGL